jgi:hypothetical protein
MIANTKLLLGEISEEYVIAYTLTQKKPYGTVASTPHPVKISAEERGGGGAEERRSGGAGGQGGGGAEERGGRGAGGEKTDILLTPDS